MRRVAAASIVYGIWPTRRPAPLSGKVIVAVLAYVISFVGLGLAWRGREISLTPVLWAAGILLLLGLAGTFPPVFEAFQAE